MSAVDRRAFLRGGAGESGDKSAGKAMPLTVRPPGAVADFASRCTGCGDCLPACPANALLLLERNGKSIAALRPNVTACRWCADMPCIAACEPNALQLPASGMPAPLATVAFKRNLCMLSDGILCDECAMVCPSSVRAIRMLNGRLPLVDPDACVGCGLCVKHCPAEPKALRVVPSTSRAGR